MKKYIPLFLVWAACLAGQEKPVSALWAQMQDAVIAHPNLAEVRRILDLGFDPNGSIGCGESPAILAAVERRDVDMTRLLLEKGAKVPDQAMLMVSNTLDGDLTLIKLLVEHGGNVNARVDTHYSCIHAATVRRNLALVQFLSKTKGFDLNVVCHDGECDGTPLMWALKIGALDVADVLASAGTDFKVTGETGATATSIISDRLKEYEKLRTAIAQADPDQPTGNARVVAQRGR